MKSILFTVFLLILISCKKESEEPFGKSVIANPVAAGKELFENKGNCISCHAVDEQITGPSVREIAKTYREKQGDLVKFLKEKADPIVDPSQYEVMRINLGITKTMTDDQLKAIEAYIYAQH